MEHRRITRNNRGLNKSALNALRRAPPAPLRPARAAIDAVNPNVARLYLEMYAAPPHEPAPRNNIHARTAAPFYPNAPTVPGPGSLAHKLKNEDPRPISSWESRIKRRKSRRSTTRSRRS